jgi:hypothetical protein
MKTHLAALLTTLAILTPLQANSAEPNVKLREWQRGFAVDSQPQPDMSVYLWFYEWHMFEAMTPGQHTRGTYELQRSLSGDQRVGRITSDALQLSMAAVTDGAELKLTVKNITDYQFPPIAATIPCFNPGPKETRNRQFANTNTYYLSAGGLKKLIKREIHFNDKFRKLVDEQGKPGEFVWSHKWPLNDDNAVGGLIVRESTDGKWACGIAWEDFLSSQGHNPWECMHLSIRIGDLKPGESKTIRGRIYLLRGDKSDVLKRYYEDFKVTKK